MTNKQQSAFFLLIVFLFACGAGLLVYRQYDLFYQEKTADGLAAANLQVRPVKQKTSAPTALADGRLQVDSPKEGDTVGQTFNVSGYAQGWFEGSIAIKVLDDNSKLLYQGNTIAGDNYGHPAPFNTSIVLTATSTTLTGKIEFNDYSAKDGSLVYQKIVNIKFSSFSSPLLAPRSFSEGGTGEAGGGDISGWKTYTNSQYGFEFQYPADLYLKNPKNFKFHYYGNGGSPPLVVLESTKQELLRTTGVLPPGAKPGVNVTMDGYDITVDVEPNPQNLSLSQLSAGLQADATSVLDVAGVQGVEYFFGDAGGYNGVLFVKKGLEFYIDIASGCEQDCSQTTSDQQQRVYRQILSTFKFIN